MLAHYVVADSYARPIEITVIAKLRSCFGQLRQQASLRGGGHAVRADQRCAVGAPVIRSDGYQIRVFTDIDLAIRYVPGLRERSSDRSEA